MLRKCCWLTLGLAICWGCQSKPDDVGEKDTFDVNNTVPPSPPGIQHATSAPAPGTAPMPPSDYPGMRGAATAASEASKSEEQKADAPKSDEAKADEALSADEIANIKKLPEADQPAALAQKVCPVSDEHLGGEMGVPVKVTEGGQTFFLCCKGCLKELKDKDKLEAALAKLKK